MREVEIRVRGQIDRGWSDWFNGLTITHTPQGETVLAGSIRDQAELRGILSRLSDLGLELISVNTLSRSSALKKPVRGGGDCLTEK